VDVEVDSSHVKRITINDLINYVYIIRVDNASNITNGSISKDRLQFEVLFTPRASMSHSYF
jgi:hypothetical protein